MSTNDKVRVYNRGISGAKAAYRTLMRSLQQSGITFKLKDREFYTKPSDRRRLEARRQKRRLYREQQEKEKEKHSQPINP